MKQFCLLILFFLIASCSDDELLKGNLYVFKGETITQYVNHQEELSMFAKLLEKSYNSSQSRTTVAALLGSRGNYSAFIPTNKAVTTYLDSIYGKGNYDIDSIPEAVANRIVLNCVMDFGDKKPILSTDFWEGTVPESMLNDNNLLIQYGNYGNGITTQINRSSYVVKHDIELSNGLAHWVDRVIDPTPQSVSMLIKDVDSLSIFYHLLEVTSWADSLNRYRDKTYAAPADDRDVAQYRMFGYTVFAESNNVFHEKWGVPLPRYNKEDGHVENWNEIMSIICQKCSKIYTNSTSFDFFEKCNALNRFVAYHIVDGKYPYNNLVTINGGRYNPFDKGFDMYSPIDGWRYYCTKSLNRNLLKITYVVKDGKMRVNRKSFYNNAFDGNYQESSCPIKGVTLCGDTDPYGYNYARNGYYHVLCDILLYTDEVEKGVLNERIRYDVTHYLPELSSAEYHQNMGNQALNKPVSIFFPWDYFRNLSIDDRNMVQYQRQGGRYESDCMFLPAEGAKSYTLKLMPVPFAGNWQVRIQYEVGNNTNSYDEVYFGTTKKVHLMTRLDLSPELFNHYFFPKEYLFMQDVQFDDDSLLCIDNDKQLYLHHIKKGPKILPHESSAYPIYTKVGGKLVYTSFVKNATARDYKHCCRNILYEGYLEPQKTYYLTIRHKLDYEDLGIHSVLSYRFLDYIELVPESVYGNPARAEDIW